MFKFNDTPLQFLGKIYTKPLQMTLI